MDPNQARHDPARTPDASLAGAATRRRSGLSRLRLRFRLRTLLAVVTLLCLLLGLASQPVIEARRERAVADALRAAGAEVATESRDFPGAAVLRVALGDWVCQRTARVRLAPTSAGARELRLLGRLKHLQVLDLQEAAVTDAELVALRPLDELRLLNLARSQVTDVGLRHLRGLKNLTSLYLSGTKIGDAGLTHLAGLNAIAQLDLRHTQVTDAGLDHLAGLARLASLGTTGTRVTYEGLARLEDRLPRGHFREMRAREEIAAMGGQIEAQSAALVDQGDTVYFETACQLRLDGTRLSGDALAHVRCLGNLKEAELVNFTLDEEGLTALAELPLLQGLTLRQTVVTERALTALPRMKCLRRLAFYDSDVTAAGLAQLARIQQLESFELHGTGVTEDLVKSLRQALPNCAIQVRSPEAGS